MPNVSDLNKIIAFGHVTKEYSRGDFGLKDVSFEVVTGEFLCIIGPSGSGKSTILKIIAGLEEPTKGAVAKPSNIGMVFQSGALLPWLTVMDNVALGLRAARRPTKETREISLKFIEMMGLADFVDKYPRELSGGQKQRVGIARALAVDPDVLLLDEPFSSLDAKITHELHQDILKIWSETKKTIVMVSHLIEEAVLLAQRILLVKNFVIDKEFDIYLPQPRHSQNISEEVTKIRREFFK